MAKTVSPFASAKKRSSTSNTKKPDNLIVAQDFTSYDGSQFSQQETSEAIDDYVEGVKLENQGDAMKKSSRPVILALARTLYANNWLRQVKRPSNPTVTQNSSGRGNHVKVIFMDASMKLDNDSYAAFANMVGEENASENVTRRDDFIFNPDVLSQDAEVKINGKKQTMNVMDAVAKALSETFAPSPEILENLFETKEVFETKKGLIDKAPKLVAPDGSTASANRLAEFLDIARIKTQLRTGQS